MYENQYNQNELNGYLMYLDANNLYDMVLNGLRHRFKWCDEEFTKEKIE